MRERDSVFAHVVIFDTIFNIKGKSILRKLGRNYFLNIPVDSSWLVLKLSFEKSGRAYVCDIDHESEMEIFEQNCRVDIETDNEGNPQKYIIDPGVRELRNLLKHEIFTDSTEYLKISQELLR